MKKKILHCLCRLGSGGVEQRRVLLARGLPKDKYEHAVICQDSFGRVPERLREAGWEIHEIGIAPHILSIQWHRRAREIVRSFRPDIIHGAVIEGVALANIAGLWLPNAKVISEETSDPVNRSWRGNLLVRGLCLRSDAVVGVSPAVVSYLRERLDIPERKLRLINNAVASLPPPDEERISLLRSSLGLASVDWVIGSVGRIQDNHKRFSDIIRSLPAIIRHQPRVKFLLVGDGPDRNALLRLTHEVGVSDRVVFAGYQSDTRDFYHLMDLFVLASAREAFGLVLVEAMSAGVPVVATNVGGVPFVLDGGRCGVLVPSMNPERLADAVIHLISDDSARSRLGDLGRSRAASEFSEERYCREVDELYEGLSFQ